MTIITQKSAGVRSIAYPTSICTFKFKCTCKSTKIGQDRIQISGGIPHCPRYYNELHSSQVRGN